MARRQRLLTELAKILRTARDGPCNDDSVVSANMFVLRRYAEALESFGKSSNRAPHKKTMHYQWALMYWLHRADDPADIARAIAVVQQLTEQNWPWEPKPKTATIERRARALKNEIFRTIQRERDPVDLAALTGYLRKRSRRGRL